MSERLDLAATRERLKWVSPGRWMVAYSDEGSPYIEDANGVEIGWFDEAEDRAFVVDARTLMPALLDECERLRAKVERVEALHTGTHWCHQGTVYTDDPNYNGAVARKMACPTRAALGESA